MGFCIRAVHSRNPGKHCINHLFSPDAECRAFNLNEEQGAGGGWDEWMGGCGWVGERGREKHIEAKSRDVMVPVGMESPCLTQ